MTEDLGMKNELIQAEDLDRLIEMAWEDRTPFEAIEAQFGLKVVDDICFQATRSSEWVRRSAKPNPKGARF